MAEITYLPEVECQVSSSDLLDTYIVGVRDAVSKKTHFLRVSKSFVNQDNKKTYLPIGVVRLDYDNQKALIELPREADSGANRLWVSFSSFRPDREDAS
jgi:hypothetical protein